MMKMVMIIVTLVTTIVSLQDDQTRPETAQTD